MGGIYIALVLKQLRSMEVQTRGFQPGVYGAAVGQTVEMLQKSTKYGY